MSRNLNTSTGPAPIRRSATAGAAAPRHAAPPQGGTHAATTEFFAGSHAAFSQSAALQAGKHEATSPAAPQADKHAAASPASAPVASAQSGAPVAEGSGQFVSASSTRMPSKRTIGIVLGVVLVLAAAALAWFALRSAADANTLAADPNAQEVGAAAPSTPVPAGSYRLVVNQFATASAGSTTCVLGFDNPAENGYSATLTLVLSESGEQLAQAGPVAPGTALEQIDMVRALEPGSYPATLLVGVLSGDSEISQLTTDLTIEVN